MMSSVTQFVGTFTARSISGRCGRPYTQGRYKRSQPPTHLRGACCIESRCLCGRPDEILCPKRLSATSVPAHLAGGLLQGVAGGGVVQLHRLDAAVVVQVACRLRAGAARLWPLRLAAQRLCLLVEIDSEWKEGVSQTNRKAGSCRRRLLGERPAMAGRHLCVLWCKRCCSSRKARQAPQQEL